LSLRKHYSVSAYFVTYCVLHLLHYWQHHSMGDTWSQL